MHDSTSRRSFLQTLGAGAAVLGLHAPTSAAEPVIQGFEAAPTDPNASQGWKPVSDRKLRVGIVGFGVCRFGAAFSFQDHPNVEVAAVSDLFPDRCAALARNAAARKRIRRWKSWSKTTRSRPCSWPRMLPVTLGTASRCSSTASTWRVPCRPVSDRSRRPTSCSKRSSRAADVYDVRNLVLP